MTAAFAVEAEAIDSAREAAYAELRDADARGLTSADLDAFETACDVLKQRCEDLRRRFYPQHRTLIIACGVAMVVSNTGLRREVVWTRPPEVDQS